MKKIVTIIGLVMVLILTGCQSEEEGSVFEGTVIQTGENYVIVEPFEDEEIRRSGTEVSITVDEDSGFDIGDEVRVTHEGPVMESHPLQINLIEIEQIN